jgi:endoglycosylceramidase
VSEFGATSNSALLQQLTNEENQSLVSWSYWAWKFYGDPTGSADESLVLANGRLRPTASVLAQTYPEAIAGMPVSMSFNPTSGAFELVYTPNHAVHAPTVVFVPTEIHYENGYCARVTGGVVTSRPNSNLLRVRNSAPSHVVQVRVTAGRCA